MNFIKKNLKAFHGKLPSGWLLKCVLALFGTACSAFGMAINSAAGLGNDPVAVFYDGIRSLARLSPYQLGVATNIINYSLAAAVFILNRKYINIGTFLYTLPMGSFIDAGTHIYRSLGLTPSLAVKILSACAGCLLLYFGISLFVSLEIGIDPVSGMLMILKDHFHCSYKAVKIACDIAALVLGAMLGGKFGAVTIVSALLGGPLIEMFCRINKKHLFVWLKICKGCGTNNQK